ncbi:CLUMA_CG012741, isoform A [Clunio marinus]|uniref:CLUMA_CG012741, isoform A n=1 Tax=Clunio marinus TaxID=568069 RepID=A0A1J1ILG1_9DIPT|nr:CLUMA_CG012741, isoform A [Clunio marinus]
MLKALFGVAIEFDVHKHNVRLMIEILSKYIKYKHITCRFCPNQKSYDDEQFNITQELSKCESGGSSGREG